MLKPEIKELLLDGTVIPAHPLALHKNRKLDEKSQRRLTNYYMDAGAGGIAVGVHTTQFEIRDPRFDLYEKVLRMAAEEVKHRELQKPFIKIAGICGGTEHAKEEAVVAKELGYDLGLLSPGGLSHLSEDEMLERTKRVSEIIPVFGFYLQPTVGGRVFSYDFWCEFADIPNVYAIKMAPFNRYQTLDVIRAVCQSKRRDEIALYTGNDDNIVQDLLTSYEVMVDGERVRKSIAGGLLGHWAVWTKRAVELFDEIKSVRNNEVIPASLLRRSQEITDANAAFFDAANGFKGCIAGINEVLARQGLLQGNWCLLEQEKLSPGQSAEIDRVYRDYPHLNDDAFVKQLNVSK
ncbi:dihydrodipicolinate synthase family protein [Fictibacillus sp. KIGAM418]|uniref:Dihydrodipicolinate synthase family protein n=1 Tax=Fictibacillus marinisediminis TaxID=2878389 RepID=A0A9X1XFS3_9BACL|nr:dihydrodipicolinate synthase family protein [Fictibacillus marinisediminis]MCK6259085.1 dihydrodipicolinate synthase family protein [Fictibacillus marinisediminis]